jgi:ADP-ribosyl-[dinitrogen reductase] hydrolase
LYDSLPTSIHDRIIGCLLAGAAGDALGAPIEFRSFARIRQAYGERGLDRHVEAYGRIGAVTDDTQMTLFTAEGLLEALGRPIDDIVAAVQAAYRRWLRTVTGRYQPGEPGLAGDPRLWAARAPSMTAIRALRSGRVGSLERPINDSRGSAGVMRVAPVGLAAARIGDDATVFDLGCRLAALTHGGPSGHLSAGAFAVLVAALVDGVALPDAVDRAIGTIEDLTGDSLTVERLRRAQALAEDGRPSPETVENLGAGWNGDEALAIAILAALTADDLPDGLRIAVNHGGDSDTTGSVAGQILGAAFGRRALGAEWLEPLELRDVIVATGEALAAAVENVPASGA